MGNEDPAQGGEGGGTGTQIDYNLLAEKLNPKIAEMVTGATNRVVKKSLEDLKIEDIVKKALEDFTPTVPVPPVKPTKPKGEQSEPEPNPEIELLKKTLAKVQKDLDIERVASKKKDDLRIVSERDTAILRAAEGITKPDIFLKFIKDRVSQGDDGEFSVDTGKPDGYGETVKVPMAEFVSSFLKENPEFAPASRKHGSGGDGIFNRPGEPELTREDFANMKTEDFEALAKQLFKGSMSRIKDGNPFGDDRLLPEEQQRL